MVIGARVDTAISGANEPLSGTERSGTFRVGTYNIRSGRAGGMESALRAMDACGVDLGLFQETKLTDAFCTRNSSGYSVLATKAASAWSGGIALFYREHASFEVEEEKVWGPNVMLFELVLGEHETIYCIGCIHPPHRHQHGRHIARYRKGVEAVSVRE